MKNLTKAINRLANAIEVQNKQLKDLRTKNTIDTTTNSMWMAILAMMFSNTPFNINKVNNNCQNSEFADVTKK